MMAFSPSHLTLGSMVRCAHRSILSSFSVVMVVVLVVLVIFSNGSREKSLFGAYSQVH